VEGVAGRGQGGEGEKDHEKMKRSAICAMVVKKKSGLSASAGKKGRRGAPKKRLVVAFQQWDEGGMAQMGEKKKKNL